MLEYLNAEQEFKYNFKGIQYKVDINQIFQKALQTATWKDKHQRVKVYDAY